VIESLRLVLRPPLPADAPAVAALANNYAVARMVSRLPYPYHREDAEAFFATLPQAHAADTDHVFVLTLNGAPIGMIGLHRRDGLFELGYWLGEPFWGQGFATEAGLALLAWAEARGERAFAARHYVENAASGHVLAKLGFRYTGQETREFCLARGDDVPSRAMIRDAASFAPSAGAG
jgi:RimJ/RimL family protein N-acetyltransferase